MPIFLPVNPYFTNAFQFYEEHYGSVATSEEALERYAKWLIEQGRVKEIDNSKFIGQVEFVDEESAAIFKLRWGK